MSSRRSYRSHNDGCAAAHALDLIGERWALIVVRELLLGPKRFAELQRDIIGISPTVLSQRLRDLESRAIALRRSLSANPGVDVYELTEWGQRLESVNAALATWAAISPDLPHDADMSPDTVILAMRSQARGDHTRSTPVSIVLNLRDSRLDTTEPVVYCAEINTMHTTIEKRTPSAAVDAAVSATTLAWKSCLFGGQHPADHPGISITGDADAVADLLRLSRPAVAG